MRIAIFGMGYVGCVSSACLADHGHIILGVDVSQTKVDLINSGQPTVIEQDLGELVSKAVKDGLLSATTSAEEAVKNTDAAIICVGTPNTAQGHLTLEYVDAVSKEIGRNLQGDSRLYTVLIRSTVPPGTNQRVQNLILESRGESGNADNSAVVSNPEFLREGTAVKDFNYPPYTVIGTNNPEAEEAAREIYGKIQAPIEVVDIGPAELLKYVNNSFHALKIAFANEVGSVAKALDIDSHELMRLFCMDDKLNISKAYLRPGFAYGGSCLPKDLKALQTYAHDHYLPAPVLDSVSESNRHQIARAMDLIHSLGKKKLSFFGISFKAGTDDLRFSPILEVIENFIGRGYDIKVFDRNVSMSRLIGGNKSFIMENYPHVGELLVENKDEVLGHGKVVIISNGDKVYQDLDLKEDQIIVDLEGTEGYYNNPNYFGTTR